MSLPKTRHEVISHQTSFDSASDSECLWRRSYLSVSLDIHRPLETSKSSSQRELLGEAPTKGCLNTLQSDEDLPHSVENQSQSSSLCSIFARPESGGCKALTCCSIVPPQDGRYSAVQGDHSTEDRAAQVGLRTR